VLAVLAVTRPRRGRSRGRGLLLPAVVVVGSTARSQSADRAASAASSEPRSARRRGGSTRTRPRIGRQHQGEAGARRGGRAPRGEGRRARARACARRGGGAEGCRVARLCPGGGRGGAMGRKRGAAAAALFKGVD